MSQRLLAILLLVVLSAPASGQQADSQVVSILADMVVQQHQFQPDALHSLGLAGLSAVLDELLPDTAQPKKADVPASTVARLLEQLGSDNFRARETASETLYQIGPGIKPAVIEATRSRDAEVAWRSRRLLGRWDGKQHEDKGRYLPAFMVYSLGIKDDERLGELLRRTLMALTDGVPEGGRYQVLSQCITTIARADKPALSAQLQPLLKHNEPQVAILAVQSIGAAVNGRYCPPLLLEALKSDREEVVSMAISYAQACTECPQKEEVKKLLVAVFSGNNDSLRFQACFPLVHEFRYEKAFEFLLKQAESADKNQRYQALSGLMNHRDQGRPPDEKLLGILVPLLKSDDNDTRRMAFLALGTYSGEAVVSSLIPLLADSYEIIPEEVGRRLVQMPDKKLTRKLLAAAAKDAPNAKVKKAAAELLDQIEHPDE